MTSETPGVALVTGAARRVGRAIAVDLARAGWAVAVHWHSSQEEADDVVGEITAAGGAAIALAANLHDLDAVSTLIPRAREHLGPVSLLINNAANFEDDRLETVTAESWSTHIDVNLRAPLFLMQAFATQDPKPAPGTIINILDERVWNLTPHFTTYTLSKAGLWTLTQTLALALAPDIRVNGIGPGPVLPSARQSDDQFRRQYKALPLKRAAGLDEICAAIRFILASPSMTGQMIALDSGQHLGWAQPGEDEEPLE
jgi:NAD(P)-dependent dehydrogenase (short-subunit alcohol dehydrogenase family)